MPSFPDPAWRPRMAQARELQHGECAVCGAQDFLNVDHNHAEWSFRGWLCSACNTGIGLFLDDPALMRSAIKYLNTTRSGKLVAPPQSPMRSVSPARVAEKRWQATFDRSFPSPKRVRRVPYSRG